MLLAIFDAWSMRHVGYRIRMELGLSGLTSFACCFLRLTVPYQQPLRLPTFGTSRQTWIDNLGATLDKRVQPESIQFPSTTNNEVQTPSEGGLNIMLKDLRPHTEVVFLYPHPRPTLYHMISSITRLSEQVVKSSPNRRFQN